ncbi:MAG TPA: hypothetical protein VFD52_07360 [Clostridia bacterium]|nr:hypothetical protein [Clostridia bacterium]
MIEFKPILGSDNFGDELNDINGIFGYVALDDGREVGACISKLEGYSVTVMSVSAGNSKNFIVEEGLLRSALYFAANRGAYIAKINDDSIAKVAIKIGFKYKNDVLSAEIPDILLGGCQGCCGVEN